MTENTSNQRRTLGWFCTYTPEEIIVAAGLHGRRILGGTGNSAKADAYLHPNLCAYVRACLSSALEGESADLAGIIGVDSCDAMRRLFDAWCHFLSPGFSHILALPHVGTPEAVKFYAAELDGLIGSLNRHFDLKITDEDLRRGIETLNETRSLLSRLSALRYKSPGVTGRAFYEALRDAMILPKDVFNARCRSMLDGIGRDVDPAGDGIRVVLSGGILDDLWVIDTIEEAGGQVAADDMCCGSRYMEELTPTNEEPLPAIAGRYLFRPPCARMCQTDVRIDRLLKLVEISEARGLIYYTVKFCDPHMLDCVMVTRELQSKGIPVLRCETDYSVSSREQMKTRIGAFLEMLR